jgi:hypothetical protein
VRPEHAPQGDPCKCGLPAARHRKRKRARADYFRGYNARGAGRRHDDDEKRQIIALDGEGYTDKKGRHWYTYLAAADEEGLVAELDAPKGVTATAVFRFLAKLPKKALLVGFSLGYDRTKWLESWPDAAIWRLVDPDRRKGEDGPLPVEWEGFRVNLVSTRLSVKENATGARRTVWDVFKFFQCSFVKALERWQIGTEQERAFIAKEKARRGSFHGIGRREKRYCQLECRLCAKLVAALIQAHDDAGLHLPSYYGPGSSAKVWLKEVDAESQKAIYPTAMHEAVLSAYFGGRFECSRVGPVPADELFAYDLASAYPAAMCKIPCMRHGRWRYGLPGNLAARPGVLALVKFRVNPHKDACEAWGPLPHRLPDGNILFPTVSAGGWAWSEEFFAAGELHPGVEPLGAWIREIDCDCPSPFRAKVESLYAERLRWGKAARGLVMRLALNAAYGASAQRVGKGRFRCMVRSGIITSTTRAALLRAVLTAKDPWNVLELATDSVLSKEPLPIEGTGLGLWERKPWPGGVFLLRPGLRFRLGAGKKDMGQTAARGLGVKSLHDNRRRVLRAWEKEPLAPVTLPTPSFFHGAKLSVRRRGPEGAHEFVRDALYGTWTSETKTISYSCNPKRESVSVGGDGTYVLHPWELPRGEECRSVPYESIGQSMLADTLDEMRQLEEDQPETGMLRLV